MDTLRLGLLHMAQPEPIRSSASGSGTAGPDRGYPQPVAGYLRCAAYPRGVGRRWRVGRPQAGRPAHATGPHFPGVHRRRRVSTTRQNPEAGLAPDLVRGQFTASGPDRIRVADITYVPTGAGFLYLAVVLDLWSRRVVGMVHAN